MSKERIDKLMVEQQLAPTRQRAQALLMAGQVLVDDTAVTKAGTLVSRVAAIRIRGEQNPYVSRGGLKMAGALDLLHIDVSQKIVLDIGASTGGFTDCCLQKGALKSYAVDVGTNQLVYSLRTDARVVSYEQTNARDITPELFDPPPNFAVIDVSFISITKLLQPVVDCLSASADILAMVKPQFEVGKDKVGKGGVVRSDADRMAAVEKVKACAIELGLEVIAQAESVISGPKGNREVFVHFKKRICPDTP
ncbi:MAG: TlyA family RNA methyltransferase [Deltaproteobacteria bacterium]|nr:TlyA family RNA methyltransferase [Deltaproteobacteria bacterium]